MRRSSRWSIAGLLIVVLAACTENPNALKHVPDAANLTITPTVSLDQSVLQILSLYPKGLETAATTRWGNIKSKYAAGLSDPAQLVVAKQMLVDLTTWLNNKTPDMATPPNNETRPAANSRAVLYMSMYVYNGPTTPPPPYNPTADAVTGLVTPGAPATIVTPTLHAGVQLEAGSVAENTIIVVRQNPTPYPANCSGPLATKLCQYPQFYFFDMFPHATLLKPAKFNVCHVNSGDNRRPLADHDRFRLAHTAPANSADYTPGSTIRNQNGENIEILPLIAQTFSTCVQNDDYPTGIIGAAPIKTLSRFARGVQRFFTPKSAYAIDVGLGGLSRSLSPFNDVDPLGTPDISVESLTANSPAATSGGAVTLTYTLRNIGTATPDPENVAILLTPAVTIEGAPVSRQVLSFVLPPIVPGSSSTTTNQSVTIPADVVPGTYHLAVAVADNPLFPDGNANNNSASLDISVNASIIDLGMLPGDDNAAAMAINEAGHVVGFGTSPNGGFAHVFRWVNGQMTSLGDVRALNFLLAINDSDVVVGSSYNPQTQLTAFRWKNGVFTDLGTLPSSFQSVGVGVNTAGDVVGWSEYTNGAGKHGWIWRDGVMTDLGLPPGASDFEPAAINDAGEIVGRVVTPSVSAWIWRNGTFTQLPVTGGGAPRSINAAGVVAGFSSTFEPSRARAIEWLNGQPLDLPLPNGAVNSVALSISSDGRIVGYTFPDQTSEANTITPVLWQSGSAINLPTLGGAFSLANGVNSRGQIVGQSAVPDGTSHAVMWQAPPKN